MKDRLEILYGRMYGDFFFPSKEGINWRDSRLQSWMAPLMFALALCRFGIRLYETIIAIWYWDTSGLIQEQMEVDLDRCLHMSGRRRWVPRVGAAMCGCHLKRRSWWTMNLPFFRKTSTSWFFSFSQKGPYNKKVSLDHELIVLYNGFGFLFFTWKFEL